MCPDLHAEIESIARPLASLAAMASAVTAGAAVTAMLMWDSCLPKTREVGLNASAENARARRTAAL